MFTAQQSEEDVLRDGLDDKYWVQFREWFYKDGREFVAYELQTCSIPEQYMVFRAPKTTSFKQAVLASRSNDALSIQRYIDEDVRGFRGRWVSSCLAADITGLKTKALGRALRELGYIPHPKLPEGRVPSPIACDMSADMQNRKTRLYVLKDGPLIDIERNEVPQAYEAAQTNP